MKIDFVLFICLYPVCTTAMKYLIVLRYKELGWEYFESKRSSAIKSVADFLIWVIVSVLLY